MAPPARWFLLLSCFLLADLVPPIQCEAGGDCSCSAANSRCDELGVCRCDPGWAGPQCDQCVLMPGCVHGSCVQPWQCSCEEGWGGRFCDKDLSVCSLSVCLQQAVCLLQDSGDFLCLCPEGFYGETCEKKKGPCSRSRSPCLNGGVCEDSDGFAEDVTCRCLAGFAGRRCETDVDDCALSPCANGATCLDGVNRFSCVCPAGFGGRFCSVNVDECVSAPCLHGGRCLDRAAGFQCVCRPGFSGATCQTKLRAQRGPGTASWEEGGAENQATPPGNISRHGDQPLRVTVSERGAGTSRVQLAVLLLVAMATLGVVSLTAALLLQGRHGHATWRGPPSPREQNEISSLNPAEGQKKKPQDSGRLATPPEV